jgi:hypothetical protein
MNSTTLATVHPLELGGSPAIPIPRHGVAAVSTLATPLSHRGLMEVAELQPELDLGLEDHAETSERPHLRLITTESADVEDVAARFARALVEVVCGDRGVHQLLRWTTDEVYRDLLGRSEVLQRAAANGKRVRLPRALLRSIHLSQPRDDSAELSIHVRHGARSRAIAARIEHAGDRWLCTALQFG